MCLLFKTEEAVSGVNVHDGSSTQAAEGAVCIRGKGGAQCILVLARQLPAKGVQACCSHQFTKKRFVMISEWRSAGRPQALC